MQLTQLAYFTALADTRHFTRAAEAAGVSQPTLSQQVRALERSLGAELVVRRPGSVELTAAGDELLPIARRILSEAAGARLALSELDGLKRGRVHLGATPSLLTGLVPGVLAGYQHAHPGVTIRIAEGGSRDLQARLSAGGLDLALLVDSRANDDANLTLTPLFVEELVVISRLTIAAPTASTPTSPARMDLNELRDRPLVMFREGYDLRETTIAACRDRGFEPRMVVEGGEMDAVLSFVAAGLGVAVVPSTVAGPDRFRITRLAEPGLGRTVQLVRRAGVELSRAAADLETRLLQLRHDA